MSDETGLAGLAPAKLNLALHVTGQRADGYHLIESLSVFTTFGDHVTVRSAGADQFSVAGPFAQTVPSDGSNIVLKARDLFRATHQGLPAPVSIHLHKRLPPSSGIGGGSSDAAALLTILARGVGLTSGSMQEIGARLGADVPMCLAARPLIARGVGEFLELLGVFPALDVVLVNPGVSVATPEVFSALAEKANPPLPDLPSTVTATSLAAWLNATRNDLMDPALTLRGEIGTAIAALRRTQPLFARMSGSGATCFGIYADAGAATHAADAIAALHPEWFVVATRTTGAEQ